MTKIHTCVTVDSDVLEQYKRLYPNNLSAYINEQLRHRVEMATGVTEAIDIQILRQNLQKTEEKAGELTAKRTELAEKLRLAEEMQAKTAEESLILEKEKILSAKRCAICTQVLEDKSGMVQLTEKIIVCKGCYNPSNPKLLALLKKS